VAKKTGTKVKYIIGIDSGATASETLLISASGGKGVFKKYPPINFNVLGFDESLNRLVRIIKDSSNKTRLKNITYIVTGISGARGEKDRKKLAKAASGTLKLKNIAVYPDTAIAFASIFSHFDRNCGILLAGTGSVLYFVNSKGIVERYGGWGRILGDEGSGYWIAREALNHITLSYDRRGKKTKLEQVLKNKYGINKENLIKKVYHQNFDIARITKYVFRAAEEGDSVSKQIIEEAAEKLSGHFIPLKKTKATIALCGSLFTEEKLPEKYLRKIVKDKYRNIKLIKPKRKPVWGAVEIAKTLLN